jgi:copper chaperone CopZ
MGPLITLQQLELTNMKRSALVLSSAIVLTLSFFGGCGNDDASNASKAVEVHVTAMGMHCESCQETIESTFMKMPGVDSVRADYKTKDVYVVVDTSQTSYDRLVDLVSELGYDTVFDDQGM